MALSITPDQVSVGKLRAPGPEPIPSYKKSGKVAWITLDEPDHMNAAHTVGDVLRGKAYIKPKQQITITSLAISFRCKIATGLTEREGIPKIYKWNGLLFSDTIEHINSPTGTTLSGEHEYPFSFTIPSTTPRSDISKSFLPTSETMFETAEGRPLPPSFHRTYALHAERVVYYLEIVAKSKGSFHRDIKDELPIQFTPARPSLNPELKTKTYENEIVRQSNLLGPLASDGRRPSAGVGNRLLGSNSVDPVARFSLTGTMPSAICIGGPIPVQIALNYQSIGSTVRDIPEVRLCNVFVRLTAWTVFRVSIKGWLNPSQIMRTFDDKIDLVNFTVTPPPILPSDGQTIQLDQIFDGFVLKPDLKPTFKSCAISRWYDMKITVELSIGGKQEQVEVGKHRCLILPALYRSEAGDTLPGQAEAEEPLPLYEPRGEEILDTEPPDFSASLAVGQASGPGDIEPLSDGPAPMYSESSEAAQD